MTRASSRAISRARASSSSISRARAISISRASWFRFAQWDAFGLGDSYSGGMTVMWAVDTPYFVVFL